MMVARDLRPSRKRSASPAPCACKGGASCSCRHDSPRGEPLPPETQTRMAAHFGHSFTSVRVHADRNADEAAAERGSIAFADGEHLYFRAGRYQPNSDSGLALIAHELAHTVQRRTAQAAVRPNAVDSEREARDAARSFSAGRRAAPIRAALAGVGLQSVLDAGVGDPRIHDAGAPVAGVPQQRQTPPASVCGPVVCPPPERAGLTPQNPRIASGSLCRGACGADCPKTCTKAPTQTFSVPDSTGACHATCTYDGLHCGSHQGCREHDACYDAANGFLEHRVCDGAAIKKYGLMKAQSWARGHGPYDSYIDFYADGVAGTPVPI
jgi:Domain of unknown function (DUF4157)